MKRLFLFIAVVLLLMAGAGPWVWNSFISPPKPLDLEPFQYTADSSWAALPVSSPPPVWTDGWGVDVFMVLNRAGLEAHSAKSLERKERLARRQALAYKTDLTRLGAVYAPLYRAAAANDDVTRAFNEYLRMRNKGRAFIIVYDGVVPAPVLERISGDADLKGRFGGLLVLASDTDAPTETVGTDSSVCGGFLLSGEACEIAVPVIRSNGVNTISVEGFPENHPVSGFLPYLIEHVGMMAEPLGDFEEIEIIDIRRPGDTDERRTGTSRN